MGTTNFDTVAAGAIHLGGTALTPTAAEINKLAGVTAGTAAASKAAVLGANKNLDTLVIADGGLKLGSGAGTAVTATAAELNKTDGVTGYLVEAHEVSFTETTGAGTYTGSVTVPAGATILDIIVNGVALWTATTSATLIVGDVTDPDGYYTAVDLKATDLLAGESISFALAGGKAGAYIANSQVSPRYSASERTISGVVTTVGAAGSAGRTRMVVVYVLPTASAASKA